MYEKEQRMTELRFKSSPTSIKSVDADAGVFEAYVSVWDNVDSYGDVMRKGAFSKTLEEWKAKGAPIPVLWSHRTDDPDMNIGHVIEAKEDDRGLLVKAQIDLESPNGATVYRLMKGGRVREFSFAYSVTDGSAQTKDGNSFYEIRGVNLYEVGPTPVGANPATELLDLKARVDEVAHQTKAGRVLSAANESAIREALDQVEGIAATLKSVLPADDSEADEDQDETSGTEPSTEATGKSSSDVTTPSPSVCLALTEIRIQEALKGAL
jgi:HK97 family phage prohead protease